MEIRAALSEAAIEYGVTRESREFFDFLVSKKLDDLGEEEELTEEDLESIAKEARSKFASPNTSVGTQGENPAPSEGANTVDLAQFQEMGLGERSGLYQKDKDLYTRLVAEEKRSKIRR